MTKETAQQAIIKAHEAAVEARENHFRSSPGRTERIKHEKYKDAESAFLSAVTDAFKVGEDEVAALREALTLIAAWDQVDLHGEWEQSLRGIIRAITERARAAIASMFTPSGEKRDSVDTASTISRLTQERDEARRQLAAARATIDVAAAAFG